MKHALVIGGTGMLVETTGWLAQEGYRVSVLARNPDKMQRLTEQSRLTGNIHPIFVDYTETAELVAALKEQIRQYGSFALVIAWVHSNAPHALPAIVNLMGETREEWSLFQVLGSSRHIAEIRQAMDVPATCRYHQVQLGFMMDDGQSRWLTNHEISAGVIEAIRTNTPILIVGTVEPWDRRPS